MSRFNRRSADVTNAVSSTTVSGNLIQVGSINPTTVNESPVTGDHLDFRGGTFRGQVIGKQYNYGARPGAGLPDPDSWPTLEEVNPVTLGVRQTRRLGEESGLAFYVTRDVDEALQGWRERDGLLVITGGPLTGKSRTAWTAMFDNLELNTRVYAPPPGTDLRALPRLLRDCQGPYVLWLDRLERHVGDQGLDLVLLDELKRLGVPVVATMSDEEYGNHRFGSEPASDLLSSARLVRLSSRWSEPELVRLADVTDDARLVDALRWCGDSGVTQYLAIGPELWEMWHRATYSNSPHPRGHLVVRAAIDLVRCGVTGGIPRELVEAASGCYGPGYVHGLPERESPEDALAWAAEERRGVTGLLVRGESGDTWRPYGSLVADVLRDPSSKPVPLAVWRCALDGTRSDADVHRNVRRTAGAFFAPKAEEGDPDSMHMMGLLSEGAEALEWLRKAVDAGKGELSGHVGELLLAREKAEDALPYLRTAAERYPDGKASRLLGKAHLMLAEHWLRKAADGGDGEAGEHLGDLLYGRGDDDEAATYYWDALEAGHTGIARSMGLYALTWGPRAAGPIWLRRAADAGDERAAELLKAATSPVSPSMQDAGELFALRLHHPVYATNLGMVMEELGNLDDARAMYHEGYAMGDPYGAYRLAVLREKQGNPERAAFWYRKAADMGHPAAKKALAEMAEKPATVKE
ncbi:tetratricopeptide repeat protein [Streptomyces sp. NPDC002888]|uniref:tetratricopeptide repeat protein n=1 Tax=Streptomyces sp. NPDC002888 TaxID=3364668 RepID=UPI003685DAB3